MMSSSYNFYEDGSFISELYRSTNFQATCRRLDINPLLHSHGSSARDGL